MQNSGQKISGYSRNNPWVSGQARGKNKKHGDENQAGTDIFR